METIKLTSVALSVHGTTLMVTTNLLLHYTVWNSESLFCMKPQPTNGSITCVLVLRWQVNNFTHINVTIVVQSLTAKLDIQVLYGKYYLCNKS